IQITGLAPDTQYLASVVAYDAAGNRSGASSGFFVTAADTQGPTPPGAAVATDVTASGATLNWAAATDDVGVAGYEVTVAGKIVSTAATTLVIGDLAAATVVAVSVRAFDAAGNRSSASTSSFTTLAAPCTVNCDGELPAGWTGQDVGSPKPGAARFAKGTFTTTANGVDIWAAQDSFHFVHQPLAGDGQVTARVNALDLTDAWAKAGVMMRASLAGNSQNVLMAVTGSNGVAFQRRTATGGASSHTGGPNVRAPHWVRLVRQGNLFTGYVSGDGSTWSIVGSQTIAMPGTVYAGLAHTSHRVGVLGNASFSNVEVAGAAADTQAPTTPGAAVASNITASGATLSWAASSDNVAVTGYEVTVGGNTVSTAAATLVVGDLAAETVYAVSVRALDAAGNRSGASTASFTTLAATCAPNCVNLAQGRTATQSSTGWGGTPGKAVDGNTEGRYSAGSVTHTNLGLQPWWQVDLGQQSDIESVQVFNRTDCCGTRLANFHVFVSGTDMSGKSLTQLIADPAVTRVQVGTLSGAASITLPLKAAGRFVKVQLEGSNYLSLAEVRVLGR
ncbi:MAG TPA: discoidin domain-containing protein, partial [Rubrivivax sp.]|nr:discoidin domain-containing protein [Rubrivivax sp.]